MRALTALPGFSRDMLFVSTKAGFLETAALQRLLASGEVAAGDVQGGISCIAPACLAASLRHSLNALSLETASPSAFWKAWHLLTYMLEAEDRMNIP